MNQDYTTIPYKATQYSNLHSTKLSVIHSPCQLGNLGNNECHSFADRQQRRTSLHRHTPTLLVSLLGNGLVSMQKETTQSRYELCMFW